MPMISGLHKEFLQTLEPFQDVSERDLDRIADCFEERTFPEGQVIVRRGEPGDALYVLREGRVLVPILDSSGKERFRARLGQGDLFGEIALLTGQPRNADVIAETAVDCLVLPRESLQDLLRTCLPVARFLTGLVGERLVLDGGIRRVGKYRVIGELGRGGMSRVFEGRHLSLDLPVAIKMLSHDLAYDLEFTRRFREESKILASLDHEGIVRVIDVEEAYATLFIVMEKVTGTDLGALLRARGPLPEDEVRSILRQVALILDYAHSRGVVHRDIKPGNVMIEPDGRVRLMDFGISRSENQSDRPAEPFLGTPEYASPEQAKGSPLDGRADIYALGILAFEMLLGHPPFESENLLEVLGRHREEEVPELRSIRKETAEDLNEVVRIATRKDPRQRFARGSELAARLLGTDDTGLDLARAHSQSLTILFDPAREDEVGALVARFEALLEETGGMKVIRRPGIALRK